MNDKNTMNDVKNYLMHFDYILNNMRNKMLNPILTNNITIDFIRCMIPHHEAAIYMCQNLLNYNVNDSLKRIANNIIRTQTSGIKIMQSILLTTHDYINSNNAVSKYLNNYFKITKEMLYRMNNSLKSTNINLNFISEMIPHHEGAIAMCNNLLLYNIDPRLKRLAESIIIEQSRGIEQLKHVWYELKQM